MKIEQRPFSPAVILTLTLAAAAAATVEAPRVLEQSGIEGGLAVHVGCGDGALIAALGADCPEQEAAVTAAVVIMSAGARIPPAGNGRPWSLLPRSSVPSSGRS